MKKAIANLDWSLFIECPYCNVDMDLADADIDYDYMFSKAIFYNEWENLKDIEVECSFCDQTFLIEEVIY